MQTLAFVFPGQGSQQVGMLADLAEQSPIIEETFAQASAVLNYDLWAIVKNGPEAELNKTLITQPALLAADIALWRLWQQKQGAEPSFLAGHSLGEYAALVAAQTIDFSDAIAMVAERAKLMQNAVPEGKGAMAAILGLEDAQIEALCQRAQEKGIVEAVNYNSPGQVVIAGEKQAVEYVSELAKEAGAKRAVLLAVSVPSHSSLMQEAATSLEEFLEKFSFQPPKIPVIHNVNAQIHTDPKAIKSALVKQLYKPVLWVNTMQYLQEQSVNILVECGPGKVLIGLAKRILKASTLLSLAKHDDLDSALNINKN